MKTSIIITLYFLSSAFLLQGQGLYFPDNNSDEWESISPESLNYCQDNIEELYDFLEINNTRAFILLQDGKIVLEEYFYDFEQDSSWYWASAGKTLTAVLVGLAEQQGALSLDASSRDYLGEAWSSCTSQQEEAIKVRHHLSMTTGLEDGLGTGDCWDPECLEYLAEPGERWAYHNGAYTLLDKVIEGATGQGINLFLWNELRNEIGMNGAYIPLGYNNVYFSSPRSMARFGLFLLSEGSWDGQQILDNVDYFQQMTNSSQTLNSSYGYLTWLNGKDSYMLPLLQTVFSMPFIPDAPEDTYMALGKDGQLINVVPSKNMVWIRMGEAPNFDSGLTSPNFNNDVWLRINDLACTSSTKELEANAIMVYPSIAHDQLELEIPHDISINTFQISSAMGEQWVLPKYESRPIDISFLVPGTYWLQMILGNGDSISKMFVKH